MSTKMFDSLKVGQKVRDTWYGDGMVVAKGKRRCTIKLYLKGIWKYDKMHVNHFILRGNSK